MKHNNKINKNKKTNNHKEVEENKQTQNKKHKKHSLSHAQPKEKEGTEIINEPKYNSEVIEKQAFKQKTSKKVHHSKRKRRPSQNETKIEELSIYEPKLETETEIEDVELEVEDIRDENNGFRCEEKGNIEFNEENLKRKFENLVWSEDKFPKK